MSGEAGKSKYGWGFCDRYDWLSWTSWRALFTTAAIFGMTGAAAVLIAESVVRDVLGMALGRAEFPNGPDLLVAAVAFGITLPCFLIWVRVLYNSDDGAVGRSTGSQEPDGLTQRRVAWFVIPCWMLSAMAVSLLLYIWGVGLIGVAETSRIPALIILLPVLTANGSSLHMGLRTFGARPLISGTTVQ